MESAQHQYNCATLHQVHALLLLLCAVRRRPLPAVVTRGCAPLFIPQLRRHRSYCSSVDSVKLNPLHSTSPLQDCFHLVIVSSTLCCCWKHTQASTAARPAAVSSVPAARLAAATSPRKGKWLECLKMCCNRSSRRSCDLHSVMNPQRQQPARQQPLPPTAACSRQSCLQRRAARSKKRTVNTTLHM